MTTISFLLLAVLPEGRLNDFYLPSSEAVLVARSLAANNSFADPFVSMKTGVTAHVAPAYPFFYSLILRALGTGRPAVQFAWACNVFFLALQMGLLPLLSARLQFGVLPGILAAVLGTFSVYAPIDARWESLLTGTLLLLAFLTMQKALTGARRNAALGAGLLWGLLLLTSPVLILLLLFLPLSWILSLPRQSRSFAAARWITIVAIALLIVSPWMARNYTRFGNLIFVRDNLGLELYTGNNSCAAPSLQENLHSGCHFRTHPNANAEVAAQLAASGEVAFNRAKLGQAIVWTKANPVPFLGLTAKRMRLFWLPDLDSKTEEILVWLITLLSVPGLLSMAGKNRIASRLFLATWLLFPLIYYVIQFEPRYRFPIFWTSLLPAGYALVAIASRLSLFPVVSHTRQH